MNINKIEDVFSANTLSFSMKVKISDEKKLSQRSLIVDEN